MKYARYQDLRLDASTERELHTAIDANLEQAPLAGFVAEGSVPFGTMSDATEAALHRAVLSGMPVVRVARGNAEGMVPAAFAGLSVGGSNLTATKARLLLMACLLRYGCMPPATDPERPTDAELEAIRAQLARYQAVFDTH